MADTFNQYMMSLTPQYSELREAVLAKEGTFILAGPNYGKTTFLNLLRKVQKTCQIQSVKDIGKFTDLSYVFTLIGGSREIIDEARRYYRPGVKIWVETNLPVKGIDFSLIQNRDVEYTHPPELIESCRAFLQ